MSARAARVMSSTGSLSGGQRPWALPLARALARCRQEEWEEGLVQLARLVDDFPGTAFPGLYYSYLGYGVARCQGQVKEGIRLCRHAVKQEFYQPENYLNLARVQLLAGNRRAACDAVERGLRIDATFEPLLRLRQEFGLRRPPVIPFLDRRNPLNQLLGWLRHQFRGNLIG